MKVNYGIFATCKETLLGRVQTRLIVRLLFQDTKMRAISVSEFGDCNVLKLVKNQPIPTPGENQVLVKVKHAGVNPVDTYIRSGTFLHQPPLPYTPGVDLAGEVVKLGSKNLESSFSVGDRVFTYGSVSGAYAEYSVVPSSSCFHLPTSLTFEQGASIGIPAFTAYRALFVKGNAQPGEYVLVHGGSGAVGVCAIQMAVAHGCKVIGTAGTDEGLKMILELGATHAFNHKDDIVDKVMDVTRGKGVNNILEMLADKNLEKDCHMASSGGTIFVIGSRGSLDFVPQFVMAKELVIQGIALPAPTDEENITQATGVTKLLQNNVLKPIVGKVFPLGDANVAHNYVIHNSGSRGKVVLSCED